MAEGATVANAFVQIMPSMEGATDNITSAILPGVNKAGEQAGASFGGMFTGKLGTMLKGVGVAAIGYLGVSALTDAFASVESGFNNVIKATGASGEAAQNLKSVYLEVSKSVVGSFDDIGEAIGELNTRFGIEGEALTVASEQTMKFAKVTGSDAKTAVQNITKLMNNAGISSDQYGETLDKLTKAAQASGIDVNKLTQSVTSNAASFTELGFTTDEAIAMLAQFEVSGADTTSILAAMKKGLANWTSEGKNAKVEFEKFVKGVQDGSVSSADAINQFGAKGGVAMYEAAKKGQLSFDTMYGAITNDSANALDAVYKDTLTAQEKFELLGQNITTGFYQIVEPIVDAIEPYMDDIISAVASAVEWFTSNAVPAIKTFIDAVAILVEGIGATIDMFVQAAGEAGAFAADVAGKIGDTVNNIISWWSAVPGQIVGFISGLPDAVSSVFWGIVDAVAGIPGQIVGYFSNLGSMITSAIGSIHFPTPHLDGWKAFEIFGMETPIQLPVINWYGHGGYFDDASIIGVGERGGEYVIPDYEPYMTRLANEITERMDAGCITINSMTVVANDPENFMEQMTAFAARTRRQYA